MDAINNINHLSPMKFGSFGHLPPWQLHGLGLISVDASFWWVIRKYLCKYSLSPDACPDSGLRHHPFTKIFIYKKKNKEPITCLSVMLLLALVFTIKIVNSRTCFMYDYRIDVAGWSNVIYNDTSYIYVLINLAPILPCFFFGAIVFFFCLVFLSL